METNENNLKVLEKPNPHARFGFVIFSPYQFYALKNIYNEFGDEAEFVADYVGSEQIPPIAFERSVEFLSQKGVSFRVLTETDHITEKSLEQFFSRYTALIGLNFAGCFSDPVNTNRVKIRVEYGAGKDLVKFHPMQSRFDFTLLYGKHGAELLKFYTVCAVVGNPRFDSWFKDDLDRHFIEEVKAKLDPLKRTFLYVPTYGSLSTLDILSRSLAELKDKFNVMVKLHHRTVYEEPQWLAFFREKGIIVVDEMADTLPLYKIADAVLGDNSSAVFEALLVKKPLVIAGFHGKEFFEKYPRQFYFKNRFQRPQTYLGSIEQQLKNKAAITITDPRELPNALENAIAAVDRFSSERDKIIQDVFAFQDGECAVRAKRAIEDFLSSAHYIEQRPPLYYIFDSFAEEMRLKTVGDIERLGFWEKLKFILKNLL